MKIGDEVYVHGYVDEIREGVVIIRNNGGYFGTVAEEVLLTGIDHIADRKTEPQTNCLEQFRVGLEYHTDTTHFGKTKGESVTTNKIEDEPQTDCSWK